MTLAERRPIYHSEADFQHALAWEVHKRLPHASVRLERPVKVSQLDKPLHVDLWIEQDGELLAVELKYKTRKLQLPTTNETFILRNHGAQDINRYLFVRDIQRVETIVADHGSYATGYAIMLTNDPSYWSSSQSSDTIDADFRLHEGRTLSGTLDWGTGASEGTKRGQELPLQLSGTYTLQWEDYSQPAIEGQNGKFRYLIVEAKGTALAEG